MSCGEIGETVTSVDVECCRRETDLGRRRCDGVLRSRDVGRVVESERDVEEFGTELEGEGTV